MVFSAEITDNRADWYMGVTTQPTGDKHFGDRRPRCTIHAVRGTRRRGDLAATIEIIDAFSVVGDDSVGGATADHQRNWLGSVCRSSLAGQPHKAALNQAGKVRQSPTLLLAVKV